MVSEGDEEVSLFVVQTGRARVLKMDPAGSVIELHDVTGGDVFTSGSSDNQDITINTGGLYMGRDLRTKFTTIKVNAGGRAEVYATDYVNANVKAGGRVMVYGDPEKMDQKTLFGGKIERANDDSR